MFQMSQAVWQRPQVGYQVRELLARELLIQARWHHRKRLWFNGQDIGGGYAQSYTRTGR